MKQAPEADLTPLLAYAQPEAFSTSLDLLHASEDDYDDDGNYDDDISGEQQRISRLPCLQALQDLLFGSDMTLVPLLAVATEASSHPTGLLSLLSQPWLYAGGGLGNENECTSITYRTMDDTTSATTEIPHVFQTCLAGAARRRDATLPFAGLCWPTACTAVDLQLARHNLLPVLLQQQQTMIQATPSPSALTMLTKGNRSNKTITQTSAPIRHHRSQSDDDWWLHPTTAQMQAQQTEMAHTYLTSLQHMVEINHFLGTQWTCGNFSVPWNLPWTTAFVAFLSVMLSLSWWGSSRARRRRRRRRSDLERAEREEERERLILVFDEETSRQNIAAARNRRDIRTSPLPGESASATASAFDVSQHLERLLTTTNSSTACLDGLRVFSVIWIVLGHVMAIVSSTGAGYSNPQHFMPPAGLTTTWWGQLLFSSRMAVDTFLVISGFLAVHVLKRKLPPSSCFLVWHYLKHMPMLLLTRVIRILPLYAVTLGFYTLIAPHMGSGPFWYQWLGLLKPCHEYWWTNFLFINNFWPPDTAVVDTCFYHSWYLAVDMQLFVMAPLLVMIYKIDLRWGQKAVAFLFTLSVVSTVYLSWRRHWSMNTFDGAAVARYDMEAYAKPHIRAQSYLAGMFVAMILPRSEESWNERPAWTWKHQFALLTALAMTVFVAFVTGTGAYAQRPCQYQEFPGPGVCGSAWPAMWNFLYTALGRTVWVAGIAWIIHLCVGKRKVSRDQMQESRLYSNNAVAFFLSWKCWKPLSQLSFGVYLIHPIVIFIWQLGGRDKDVFRLLSFGLDLVSICVVSYVSALLASLLVEFPCAAMWKSVLTGLTDRDSPRSLISSKGSTPLHPTETSSSLSISSDDETRRKSPADDLLLSSTPQSYGTLCSNS